MSTDRDAATTSEEPGFGDPLVQVDGLKKYFSNNEGFLGGLRLERNGGLLRPTIDRQWVRAVDEVSFDIHKGETLGLVGESGCGKSTLARTLLKLIEPTDGDVRFKGRNLAEAGGEELRTMRKDMQIIFQDPQSSLDPRMKVGPIIEEPMEAHGMLDDEGREERTRELLGKVGLDPQHYNRYPHQFSGGQRQRINLARALSVNPDFIVCDEPTSALDASIQAQVLNTMNELQDEFGLTYLFISHDLSVIRYIADRVAVMYLGEIVELADKEALFEDPQHPYTEALLSAIPTPDPRATETRDLLEGDVPSPIDPPSGCRFRTRCPKLIAPPEYDFDEPEWDAVRAFTRAVDRRAPAIDAAEADEERDVADLRRDLRMTYFEGVDVRGEAGDIVDEALDLVVGGDLEAADELLQESFAEASICAREVPEYDVGEGDAVHHANCHLHRE